MYDVKVAFANCACVRLFAFGVVLPSCACVRICVCRRLRTWDYRVVELSKKKTPILTIPRAQVESEDEDARSRTHEVKLAAIAISCCVPWGKCQPAAASRSMPGKRRECA